jgi:hypothetical protein
MDFINKGKEALSGGNNNNQQAPAQGQQQQGNVGQEDYGDKGMSLFSQPLPLPLECLFDKCKEDDGRYKW